MKEEILVSVNVLTYNHENYIRKALDSILSQKVDFSYEVLVGDDASTDATADILKEYKKRYPDRFRLFLRKENAGATRNGYYLGKRSRGKYIAILEGDDYWTDENKLKKQADFLEAHPEYSACSHTCVVVNEREEPIPEKNDRRDGYFWHFNGTVYTLKDFSQGRYSGHSGTMLMRNLYQNNKVDCRVLYKAHRMIGDRTMQLLLVSQGNIYVMQEDMSCYRLVENTSASNWQAQSRAVNKRFEEFAYICYLEKYGRNLLHLPLSMRHLKRDKLVCGAVVFLNHPNRENLKVLLSMIAASGSPFSMTLLAVRAILQKLYYRKIKGEDRPITV